MYTPNSQDTTAMDKLKQAWNDNPLLVIGVATGATMAVARLIDAISASKGRRAYARQVKRGPRKDYRSGKTDYTK